MTKKNVIFFFTLALLVLVFNFCDNPNQKISFEKKNDTLVYLNHSDTAKYVGMGTCKLCHQNIYNTFIKTGMGKSFDLATKQKSSGDFSKASIYDKLADFHYTAFWSHDSLFFKEFRLEKKDTVFERTEQVNFIIGSGQHTNSHLQSVNGYVNQMPMTYYTQKKHWDLPPGFENGFNTRFSRKIGLECMSCHNAYPNFVLGSENKYTSLPQGIDCERCHGPGSIHVAQRQTGSKIDTSKYIDYSIVNPAKLSIDAQFDICQRCHLQGNAVLKNNHSFYDFKPGKKLSDYLSVFLPKYKNADDGFIMASHADRLKQSQCFIKSYEKVKNKNALKPYKEAMTCVTCHNPHVSVRETNKNAFNDACNNCHSSTGNSPFTCSDEKIKSEIKNYKSGINCVSCHMPASGSTDIPHVSVHDHYIRKPVTKKEKEKIKAFIGLYCINEKQPDSLTKARAYLQQYEKFEQNTSYLDSAKNYLKDKPTTLLQKNIYALVQLHFMKRDYIKIIQYVNTLGEEKCHSKVFVRQSYDNKDAWPCYQIAEAYLNTQQIQKALRWFSKSVELAPYNLEFRNKYGAALASANNEQLAIEQFEFVLKENSKNISAYVSLGYIKLLQNKFSEALKLYEKALLLDPDYEPLLLNLAGYYAFMKDYKNAKIILRKIVKKNSANKQAKMALVQLENS